VAPALLAAADACGARDFAIDPDRCPPRLVERAGEPCIEAILMFRTAVGQGAGLLRIQCADAGDGPPQAWTLLTLNRNGLSPVSADVIVSQNLDPNLQLGLVWAEFPGHVPAGGRNCRQDPSRRKPR